MRSRRQKRRALQRAKKAGGKKERRNRRVATRVRTLEEGQHQLFNILKEIQEWWEAQAIVVHQFAWFSSPTALLDSAPVP